MPVLLLYVPHLCVCSLHCICSSSWYVPLLLVYVPPLGMRPSPRPLFLLLVYVFPPYACSSFWWLFSSRWVSLFLVVVLLSVVVALVGPCPSSVCPFPDVNSPSWCTALLSVLVPPLGVCPASWCMPRLLVYAPPLGVCPASCAYASCWCVCLLLVYVPPAGACPTSCVYASSWCVYLLLGYVPPLGVCLVSCVCTSSSCMCLLSVYVPPLGVCAFSWCTCFLEPRPPSCWYFPACLVLSDVPRSLLCDRDFIDLEWVLVILSRGLALKLPS